MPKRSKSSVRCLNCFERFSPPEEALTAICPGCDMEWRLFWLSPTSVKIRGPLWSKFKKDLEKEKGHFSEIVTY
jgi:hypothetical protein